MFPNLVASSTVKPDVVEPYTFKYDKSAGSVKLVTDDTGFPELSVAAPK